MAAPHEPTSTESSASNNNTPRPLEGKLAIITGASRGIGAAIAHNLASKGCSLLLNYTAASSTALTSTLAATLTSTHRIMAVPARADLGAPTGPAALIAAAQSHFHPLRIDIIINNAGIASNAPLGAISQDTFHALYAVNVLGPLLLVSEGLPFLPTDGSGRIVNLSSVSAALGLQGQSVYAGTKAAVEGMTRVWARELAARATVNAVNPGPVRTEMYESSGEGFRERMRGWLENTPGAAAGRMGEPEEVAGVVGMLCAAESQWCTGSVVCANGGMRFSV